MATTTQAVSVPFNNNLSINNELIIQFSVFDIVLVVLSMLCIIVDLITDIIIVIDYAYNDYLMWAIGTCFLIVFPSILVQAFSVRWQITDNLFSSYQWISHICLMGIFYRYYQVLKVGLQVKRTKAVTDYEKLIFLQSDLGILHLFESFLESAPQLVLQLFIILVLNEWRVLTGLSAAASLFSLAWALASYSRVQRRARPEKHCVSWMGLILQATWRIGMLAARITSLVIFAYCFRSWIFLFLLMHWSGMTLWIVNQKTDLCDTHWEEKIYNGVAGVIYCFSFFNLQEGQSRWRSFTFYLIVIFENLSSLTIFLMWFAAETPKLAITAFVCIVGGTTIGLASMLLYYRFFHPSGPIKLCLDSNESTNTLQSSPVKSVNSGSNTNTLRSLKHMWNLDSIPPVSVQNSPVSDDNFSDNKKLLNTTPLRAADQLTDSIVIIEENVMEDSNVDIKVLQSWMEETECKPEVEQPQKYKRRAICSSVDLNRLMESKDDKTETESNVSLKLVGTDEAPSEIMSAHDYENICAVNIAREAWGLRSWRGYQDIESWLHDDSVIRDRDSRSFTLTSASSEHSATSNDSVQRKLKETRTRQDDYLDTLVDDLVDDLYLEAEPYVLDSLGGLFPTTTLDTILEELEISSTSTEQIEVKPRSSSLVTTIDEIRRNTPVHTHYVLHNPVLTKPIIKEETPKAKKKLEMLAPEEVFFLSQLKASSGSFTQLPECDEKTSPRKQNSPQKIQLEGQSPEAGGKFHSLKREKKKEEEITVDGRIKKIKQNRPRRKFSLIREKFESKLSDSTTELFHSNESLKENPSTGVEIKVVKMSPTQNKENIPTVASKITYWDKLMSSRDETSPRKKNTFFKQVLTPQKVYKIKKKSPQKV